MNPPRAIIIAAWAWLVAAPWPALAQEPAAAGAAEPDLVWALLKTTGGLAVVLALMLGLLWLMRRFTNQGGGAPEGLRLVGRLSLGPRKWLGLVELADRVLVLGVSDNGVTLLETIDDPAQVARLTKGRPGFALALKKARGQVEDRP